MEVRLKKEWLGHHSGDIVKVTDDCANTLFQQDAAEQMEPESSGEIRQRIRGMVAQKIVESLKLLRKHARPPISSRRKKTTDIIAIND